MMPACTWFMHAHEVQCLNGYGGGRAGRPRQRGWSRLCLLLLLGLTVIALAC